MAIERIWLKHDPVAFTANGTLNGVVTLTSTFCFKVKQRVILRATGFDPIELEIKRVLSETQMILGPIKESIKARIDLSAYILAASPTVEAPEQDRPKIAFEDFERAVYEEEPTVAKRVYNVDKWGNPYTMDNPFPVEGTFSADIQNAAVQKIKVLIPANTNEFSYALPDKCAGYRIKVKKGECKVYLAYIATQTVVGGDNVDIERGSYFFTQLPLDLPNGTVLYLRVDKPNVSVEIASWHYL